MANIVFEYNITNLSAASPVQTVIMDSTVKNVLFPQALFILLLFLFHLFVERYATESENVRTFAKYAAYAGILVFLMDIIYLGIAT